MSSSTGRAAAAAAATALPTKKEIKAALMDAGLIKVDNDVLSKCVALASTLHLTTSQMAEVWEAYSINKHNLTELTHHQFEAYKNELIKVSQITPKDHTAAATAATTITTPGSNNSGGAIMVNKRQLVGTNMVTPPTAKRQNIIITGEGNGGDSPTATFVDKNSTTNNIAPTMGNSMVMTTMTMMTPPPKYEERTKVGQVVASYSPTQVPHENNNSNSNNNNDTRRCELSTTMVGKNNIVQPYRHMFTTLEDRAKALERSLVERGRAIIDQQYRSQKDRNNHPQEQDDIMAPPPQEEVNVPRQDEVTVVGRICNEAHEGKLNPTSVVLEGSSTTSGGARINVDLTQLQEQQQQQNGGYSVFPGQIVAIEGINPTGRKFIAHRIVEGVVPPPTTSTVKDLRSFYPTLQHLRVGENGDNKKDRSNHSSQSNNINNDTPPPDAAAAAPLKVVTACGPFTTNTSMDYQPIIDLMHVILDDPPDVVILMGPFVDMRQPLVQSPNGTTIEVNDDEDDNGIETVVSYETLFAHKISALIEEALNDDDDDEDDNNSGGGTPTQFVLIPALEDATAKCVYPQPPLQDRLPNGGKFLKDIPGAEGIEFGTLGLYRLENTQAGQQQLASHRRKVHCLSNPCTFQINEVVFGVTSTDVLFHISAEETNANLPAGSRLKRIAQHMIQQASYYPLFPPHKSVNLDLKQQKGWTMPCRPDVLIVPSKLTPFCAPVLESTIVINPGHLTKGTTGGTYATMEIAPPPIGSDTLLLAKDDDDKEEVLLPHNVQDRMKVQVKRI